MAAAVATLEELERRDVVGHLATLGQRLMGLEVRMWFGGKVSPLVAAFHALLFWFSLVVFCPILLWALFDPRKRCLHDIVSGLIVVRRQA